MLTWSLALCTYERTDILADCVRLALAQTRPPAEIVIVDASADWESARARIASLAASTGTPLIYERAETRSSAIQRNQAVALCGADILFLIDDDSFMHRDCAEIIMTAYEADPERRIAAIGGVDGPPPDGVGAVLKPSGRKRSGLNMALAAFPRIFEIPVIDRIFRNVLMMNHHQVFIPYDTETFEKLSAPPEFRARRLRATYDISGYALTVRREVAEAEKFDPILRYYAALEDADAVHRFRRHGMILRALDARIHHLTSAGGRLPRRTVTVLQLMNLAVFLRRHARPAALKRRQYRTMLRRRLFAEAMKDLLSGRFGFPQVRAVIYVMRNSGEIFERAIPDLERWYPEFQRRLAEA